MVQTPSFQAKRPSYQAIVTKNEMIDNIFETFEKFIEWPSLKEQISHEENLELCKSMFSAHKKQFVTSERRNGYMVTKELLDNMLQSVDDIDTLKNRSNLSKNYHFQNNVDHHYNLQSINKAQLILDLIAQYMFNPTYMANHIFREDRKKETLNSLLQGQNAAIWK